MIRRLDTSELGPIYIDPSELANRARITREALAYLADQATDLNVASGLDLIAKHADDATLRHLRRLLR